MKYSIRNLAFLIALTILSSCALTANYGPDAKENKTQIRTFESTFDSVYRAAVQVAAEQNWSIKNSEKSAGYFMAETPRSMKAWSDEVNVTISEEKGLIKVTVKSNLGQKPNREVVSKYLTALEQRISQ